MHPELNSENDRFYQPEGLYKKTGLYFGLSFAAHMFLVLALLFMPEGKGASGIDFSRFESMDVQLVSLSTIPPSSQPGQGSGGAAVEAPETMSAEDFRVEEEVSREPEPIPMKPRRSESLEASQSLVLPDELRPAERPVIKRSTPSGSSPSASNRLVLPEEIERDHQERRVTDTVRRLQEEAETREERRQASVRDRIAQMEGEIGQEGRRRGSASASGQGSGDGARQGGGGRSGDYTRLQIYQAEVYHALRKNWVFSEALAGNTRGLETRIVITIMPDGEITDVWFEKRSGNTHLDESAYKTVMKSNPLPPLPDGRTRYTVGVAFTPGGLVSRN